MRVRAPWCAPLAPNAHLHAALIRGRFFFGMAIEVIYEKKDEESIATKAQPE